MGEEKPTDWIKKMASIMWEYKLKNISANVRFITVNFRRNIHAALEKIYVLWSVCFIDMSTLERVLYESSFKNIFGTNQTVQLMKVSTSEDVSFRDIPL